ncbi:MAG: hypothetical protein COA78_36210 [Blastopirellula sp.]|nr:MAG: hypothetical protein COA78_36210 [Blastopirellula sp.]
MKRTILLAVACLAVMFTVGQVQAAIVAADWQSSGDNKLTVDTATGLAWLDLTETFSLSYNAVSPLLASGQSLDGFRFATAQEVHTLMSNAGLYVAQSTDTFTPTPGQVAAVDFLAPLLGETLSLTYGSDYYGSRGVVENPLLSGNGLMVGFYYKNSGATYVNDYFNHSLSSTGGGKGVWLVQDTEATPEPTSLAIFGIGALCMGAGAARRRRKEKQAAEA